MAQDVLAVVADVLVGHPANDVEVEGHTDNRPTSTARFATNWELSSARATNVLRELLADAELEPARFAAVGRADTIPRGDNDTEEGRAENRRTEIVVLFPETAAQPADAGCMGGLSCSGLVVCLGVFSVGADCEWCSQYCATGP